MRRSLAGCSRAVSSVQNAGGVSWVCGFGAAERCAVDELPGPRLQLKIQLERCRIVAGRNRRGHGIWDTRVVPHPVGRDIAGEIEIAVALMLCLINCTLLATRQVSKRHAAVRAAGSLGGWKEGLLDCQGVGFTVHSKCSTKRSTTRPQRLGLMERTSSNWELSTAVGQTNEGPLC